MPTEDDAEGVLKTREDVLRAIAELRAMIRLYQAEKWASWRSALQDMIALLDDLERKVQAVGWPPAGWRERRTSHPAHRNGGGCSPLCRGGEYAV